MEPEKLENDVGEPDCEFTSVNESWLSHHNSCKKLGSLKLLMKGEHNPMKKVRADVMFS